MRTSIVLLLFALPLLAGCAGMETAGRGDGRDRSRENDYAFGDLDSYGQWITLDPFGRVWKPDVPQEWSPFEDGHWDYTDPDWTWVSNEPFGWIVYHYGNWLYSPYEGWVWIPGDGAWSPARVEWCTYGDYICWAPLPPRGIVLPQPWEPYATRVPVWNVVSSQDFTSVSVGEHRIPAGRIRPAEGNVRPANRRPDRAMIERRMGRPVEPVTIPREPVRIGKRQFEHMRPPATETKQAEKSPPKNDAKNPQAGETRNGEQGRKRSGSER